MPMSIYTFGRVLPSSLVDRRVMAARLLPRTIVVTLELSRLTARKLKHSRPRRTPTRSHWVPCSRRRKPRETDKGSRERSIRCREAPSGKEIRTGSEVGGTGVVTVVGVGAGSTRGEYEIEIEISISEWSILSVAHLEGVDEIDLEPRDAVWQGDTAG